MVLLVAESRLMHFYDFNIGDYAKKTRHLTNDEDLAYRRLLDMYYDTEQPITHRLATLSRLLRTDENSVKNVMDEFFPDGKNRHCDEVIAEYHTYCEKQKLNGSKGGRPKHKPTDNPVVSQNNPVPSQPLPTNHLPLPINQGKSKDMSAPSALLASLGVEGQLAQDFITLRKQKKASITETSLKGICREASKANLTPMEAIQISCERGWASFKAEWVAAKTGTVQEAQLDIARQIWGNQNGNDRSFIDIDANGSIEGHGAGIPKALTGIRESVAGEVEGD